MRYTCIQGWPGMVFWFFGFFGFLWFFMVQKIGWFFGFLVFYCFLNLMLENVRKTHYTYILENYFTILFHVIFQIFFHLKNCNFFLNLDTYKNSNFMATTTDVSSPVSVILSESDEDDIGGNNDFGSSEALNETNSTLTSSSKCKTGRFKSDIWALFTDTERPNQLKEVFCKHCKIKVHHHKKSELARQHLLRCSKFRQYMQGIAIEDRPDWLPLPQPKRPKLVFDNLLIQTIISIFIPGVFVGCFECCLREKFFNFWICSLEIAKPVGHGNR